MATKIPLLTGRGGGLRRGISLAKAFGVEHSRAPRQSCPVQMAAVNRTQSKRFARFGDAWLSRQSRFAGECGCFSTAFLHVWRGWRVQGKRVATKDIPLLTEPGGGR